VSVLYIVFPLALLLALAAVIAYIWAVRSGQFDDMETPAMRVLHDDEQAASNGNDDRSDEPDGDVR